MSKEDRNFVEDCSLVFDRFTAPLREASEPDDEYIVRLDADIVWEVFNGDDSKPNDLLPVGRVGAYWAQLGRALDNGCAPFDVLDALADTAPYCVLLDPEWGFREKVLGEMYTPAAGFNLLILDEIEIEAAYRGHGLGLLAAFRVIELFGNDGMVAAIPTPTGFPDEPTPAFRDAALKLIRYWAQLGFVPVPNTPGIIALSSGLRNPTRNDVLKWIESRPARRVM